jgi:hypothetical protein
VDEVEMRREGREREFSRERRWRGKEKKREGRGSLHI